MSIIHVVLMFICGVGLYLLGSFYFCDYVRIGKRVSLGFATQILGMVVIATASYSIGLIK
jgi:hypothetical protein